MGVWGKIENWVGNWSDQLLQVFKPLPEAQAEQQSLEAMAEAARQELLAAKELFEGVTDPLLVDHAIHQVIAAERKYIYLLRLLREGERP